MANTNDDVSSAEAQAGHGPPTDVRSASDANSSKNDAQSKKAKISKPPPELKGKLSMILERRKPH